MKPPFRADHVGSLLRPKRLLERRDRFFAGNASAEELRAVEAACIAEAVEKQQAVGLSGITDGEFRRTYFYVDFLEQLDGVVVEGGPQCAAAALLPADQRLDQRPARRHDSRHSSLPRHYRSAWVAQGGYEPVAEVLFNELDVDGYFLEYDDARSGDFAQLRFVPEGKTVVLGVMTSKKAALESKDFLVRRVEEAATLVPLEQLALSPQCGFSSTVHGNDLSEGDQRRKLERLVETANAIRPGWQGARAPG